MNLLIDTHAIIWFITEDDRLPIKMKELIEDATNTCFVSIASLWEMSIKYSLGKLDLKTDLKRIFEIISQSGLLILPITTTHILTTTSLDFHHRDPVDRLMIAQTKSEGLTLLSKDGVFKEYNINLVWSE